MIKILYVSRTEDNQGVVAKVVCARANHGFDFRYTRDDAVNAMNLYEYAGVVLFGSQINPGKEPHPADFFDNAAEVVRKAKEKGLPVLVIDDGGFRKKALEAGADVVLEMPCHPDNIVVFIRRCEKKR